jgi:hypothetical protein
MRIILEGGYRSYEVHGDYVLYIDTTRIAIMLGLMTNELSPDGDFVVEEYQDLEHANYAYRQAQWQLEKGSHIVNIKTNEAVHKRLQNLHENEGL